MTTNSIPNATPDLDNAGIFAPLEAHIRTEEYHDTDVFQTIGDYCVVAPHVARALALHTRDVLHEHGSTAMTYTDIIVMVWYRAFFSPQHAPLYGTDQMVHDPAALTNFAKFVIDPASANASNVTINAVPHRH